MKSVARSILLSLCVALLPVVPERGAKCKCEPSPPGGVTECQSGQIAICGGEKGVCKGSCFSVNAKLQPLQYSAEVLSGVFEKPVSAAYMKQNQKETRKIVQQLLKGEGKTISVGLDGVERLVCIGLTEVARNKLKAFASGSGGGGFVIW